MAPFLQMQVPRLSGWGRSAASGVAMLAMLLPCSVIAQPAADMDERAAQRMVIAATLRASNPVGIAGISQTFIDIPVRDLAFPGDVASLGDDRFLLDSRDKFKTADDPQGRNLQDVESWYAAQIPGQMLGTLTLERMVGGRSSIKILYLPACQPRYLGKGVDLGMDGGVDDAVDAAAYEQARIMVALEKQGVMGVEAPLFGQRSSGDNRARPDPAIKRFNKVLMAERPNDHLLVLEGFCGKLPVAIPTHQYHTLRRVIQRSPLYYRLILPAGVASANVAPLFWADVCKAKTGSATVIGATCAKWVPVGADGLLQGSGPHRLVAKTGTTATPYRYDVKPLNKSENGTAPPVTAVPEE
jgi:hypothetical protein